MDHIDRRALVTVHHQALWRLVRRLSSSDDEADEMVQDLAVVILAHRHGPSDASTFMAWCRGIARHLAAHRRRSFARRSCAHEVDRDVDSIALVLADDLERRAIARQELAARTASLDAAALSLLLDRFVLEETAPEIAARLDVSAASVRMRIARLLAAVKPAAVAKDEATNFEQRWTESEIAGCDWPSSGN